MTSTQATQYETHLTLEAKQIGVPARALPRSARLVDRRLVFTPAAPGQAPPAREAAPQTTLANLRFRYRATLGRQPSFERARADALGVLGAGLTDALRQQALADWSDAADAPSAVAFTIGESELRVPIRRDGSGAWVSARDSLVDGLLAASTVTDSAAVARLRRIGVALLLLGALCAAWAFWRQIFIAPAVVAALAGVICLLCDGVTLAVRQVDLTLLAPPALRAAMDDAQQAAADLAGAARDARAAAVALATAAHDELAQLQLTPAIKAAQETLKGWMQADTLPDVSDEEYDRVRQQANADGHFTEARVFWTDEQVAEWTAAASDAASKARGLDADASAGEQAARALEAQASRSLNLRQPLAAVAGGLQGASAAARASAAQLRAASTTASSLARALPQQRSAAEAAILRDLSAQQEARARAVAQVAGRIPAKYRGIVMAAAGKAAAAGVFGLLPMGDELPITVIWATMISNLANVSGRELDWELLKKVGWAIVKSIGAYKGGSKILMWVIGGTGIGLPAAVLLNVCLNGMYTIKIGNAVAGLFDSDHWSDEDLMDMAKSIAQHLVPSVSDVVDLWDTLVEFKDSIKTAWNNRPQPA